MTDQLKNIMVVIQQLGTPYIKMETNQKITYGAIGLLTLLVAALGGSIYLTPDQLDHAYICTANQNVIIADHLSSTQKTAYWTDESGIDKSKVCTNGLWTGLKQYAKDNNIAINVLLQNVNQEPEATAPIQDQGSAPAYGTKYSCNDEKCVRIS